MLGSVRSYRVVYFKYCIMLGPNSTVTALKVSNDGIDCVESYNENPKFSQIS